MGDDPLGGVETNGTIGGEGCAVAAAAMVFKFYGMSRSAAVKLVFDIRRRIHRARLALLGPRRLVRSRSGASRV